MQSFEAVISPTLKTNNSFILKIYFLSQNSYIFPTTKSLNFFVFCDVNFFNHRRVSYEWHTSTYEWHTDDIRVHRSTYEYVRITYEYIQVTYGWHTSTYEWHASTYKWYAIDKERKLNFPNKNKVNLFKAFWYNSLSKYLICKRVLCMPCLFWAIYHN